MLKDIPQVQNVPLSYLKLTHFVGLMTFTKDQYLGFFTQENPAPAKVAEQWAEFLSAYNVLNEAYQFDKYSLDTGKLKKTDDDCDTTFMAVKKMTQAQQNFEFNLPVKEAADRMMVCIDKYDIDRAEDYLGENNKLQQMLEEINNSPSLTADAQTLGLTSALAQLSTLVTLMRTLLTQRGMAAPSKGAMKAARAAMEEAYRWLIVIINAATMMDANPSRFSNFILALNRNIDYLRVHALTNGGATDGSGSNSNGSNGSNGQNGSNEGGETPDPGTGGNDGGQQGGGQQGGGETPVNPGGGDTPGGGGGSNPEGDDEN